MSRQTQILPLGCSYSSWGLWAPCDCPDLPCSSDSGRYNVGCTKRVGLFHSDRSKLQKAGATTHNRRRASKASLPTLTKDTKKQVRGQRSLELILSSLHRLPFLAQPWVPTVLSAVAVSAPSYSHFS